MQADSTIPTSSPVHSPVHHQQLQHKGVAPLNLAANAQKFQVRAANFFAPATSALNSLQRRVSDLKGWPIYIAVAVIHVATTAVTVSLGIIAGSALATFSAMGSSVVLALLLVKWIRLPHVDPINLIDATVVNQGMTSFATLSIALCNSTLIALFGVVVLVHRVYVLSKKDAALVKNANVIIPPKATGQF